jgi:hypothetical protein
MPRQAGLRLKSGLVAFGRASACADGGGWGYRRLGRRPARAAFARAL